MIRVSHLLGVLNINPLRFCQKLISSCQLIFISIILFPNKYQFLIANCFNICLWVSVRLISVGWILRSWNSLYQSCFPLTVWFSSLILRIITDYFINVCPFIIFRISCYFVCFFIEMSQKQSCHDQWFPSFLSQTHVKVGKSQKVFSIWPYPPRNRTKSLTTVQPTVAYSRPLCIYTEIWNSTAA